MNTATGHVADTAAPSPRHATHTATAGGGLDRAVTIGLIAVGGVVAFLAMAGQVGFAEWADITGPTRFAVPFMTDVSTLLFFALGLQAAGRGQSPWIFWTLGTAVQGFSIYTNVAHAGHRAGLVYGGASAVGLLFLFAKMVISYRTYRRTIDMSGLGGLWWSNPRRAFRSVLVRQRVRGMYAPDGSIRDLTTTEALSLAETWCAVFDDLKGPADNRVKRSLRSRQAWRFVLAEAGAPVAKLPGYVEIERVYGVDRAVELPPARPAPAQRVAEEEEEAMTVPTAFEHAPKSAPVSGPPARPSAALIEDTATFAKLTTAHADRINMLQEHYDRVGGYEGAWLRVDDDDVKAWPTKEVPIEDTIRGITGTGNRNYCYEIRRTFLAIKADALAART